MQEWITIYVDEDVGGGHRPRGVAPVGVYYDAIMLHATLKYYLIIVKPFF